MSNPVSHEPSNTALPTSPSGAIPGETAAVSHAAQPAALGYVYQAQYALMELLRDGPERPDWQITLEKYDDVAWGSDDAPVEKLQTKYRRLSTRNLGDRSPDLWKTIKSWLDGESPTDVDGARLFLVTTEVASDGTAAAALRAGDTQKVTEAMKLLAAAAVGSTDASTKLARDAYLALMESERFTFVSRIVVIDGAPTLPGIAARLTRFVKPFAPHGQEDIFTTAVLGWWYQTSIGLLDDSIDSISYEQAHADISRIRDRFLSDDTLPPVPGEEDPISQQRHDELQAAHADSRFVQRLIDVAFPPRNLQYAVLDYYRAFSATTFWLQNGLVMPPVVQLFEARLKEEWDREFEFMCVDLPEDADEQEKQRQGRALLRRLLDAAEIRIRPAYTDTTLARGTRHVLSDRNEIGWHPDFKGELEALLSLN